MVHLIVDWLLSALALWIVAQIIPGIVVRGYGTALVATIVIAVVNFVIGWPLRILTFPLSLLTLGLFLLVLNAFLLKLASIFVPGFSIKGFLPAFFGSIVLTVLGYILRHMVFYRHARFFY
jgi:putative membrane protein